MNAFAAWSAMFQRDIRAVVRSRAQLYSSILTPLLFLVQKSHIQKVLQSRQDSTDTKLIDYTRAKLVREALPQERGG